MGQYYAAQAEQKAIMKKFPTTREETGLGDTAEPQTPTPDSERNPE